MGSALSVVICRLTQAVSTRQSVHSQLLIAGMSVYTAVTKKDVPNGSNDNGLSNLKNVALF